MEVNGEIAILIGHHLAASEAALFKIIKCDFMNLIIFVKLKKDFKEFKFAIKLITIKSRLSKIN